MKKFVLLSSIGIGLSLLFACNPSTVALPIATPTKPQATATMLQDPNDNSKGKDGSFNGHAGVRFIHRWQPGLYDR